MSSYSDRPSKSRVSSLASGVYDVLSGRVSFARATLEAFRRGRAAVRARRERAMLDELVSQPARLRTEFQKLSSADLLNHFRERETPAFFLGLETPDSPAGRQRDLFPEETARVIESALLITREHRWPLLGFGEKEFGHPVNWHRDPLSGRIWPLNYHADVPLWHDDRSDIRVLWELNRLGHLITLGRAYALTKDEKLAAECFAQLESWREQNPVGRGANWSCAMEVALRALNLLAAFYLFRDSRELSEERLLMLLTMFDQHGSHIRRNLEFSHVATSNHYLSDVVGLLWLGIMLPELSAAHEWREFALVEMLHEMDKQVLPDGADYEASTGYHRLVLELFLYSFALCRVNKIPIADKYWRQLQQMLVYQAGILRPDGFAPLIGDTDGAQVLPIISRSANDHAYLLALGAAVFEDSRFKLAHLEVPAELYWLLGEDGWRTYERLATTSDEISSQAFADAGTYVLRHEDLYLLFNANGAKRGRPASHRHNDVLSLEVSAGGRAFIVDPGSYVYTADLHERHLFRSTAYHSTIQIDDAEQNTTSEGAPFAIGAETRAEVLSWESGPESDRVAAEHHGYQRLANGVTHRRTVLFNKQQRWWLIEDEILGGGEHKLAARFHFDAGLEVNLFKENGVIASDGLSGTRLCVLALGISDGQGPVFESQFVSRHYGSKLPSVTACWSVQMKAPAKLRWAIVPVRAGDNLEERMRVL